MEISAFKFFLNIFFRLRFIKSILVDNNEKIANIGACFVIFHNTEEISYIQIWKKSWKKKTLCNDQFCVKITFSFESIMVLECSHNNSPMERNRNNSPSMERRTSVALSSILKCNPAPN